MRVQPTVRAAAPHGAVPRPLVLAALLAAVLVLGGCAAGGGSGTAGDGGDPGKGSSQVSDDESFAPPETEPTTPDTSDEPSSNDNPAISVARLPVGGGSDPVTSDPRLQCAHVTWAGSAGHEIPPGTGVELTRAIFDPQVFKAVGDGCESELPNCLHYVFRTATLQCDLAVRATGDLPQDAEPSLGFTGLVYCPDNDSDTCRAFVASLADEQQLSVSLNVPQPPPEGTGPTDTATDTPTTDGG